MKLSLLLKAVDDAFALPGSHGTLAVARRAWEEYKAALACAPSQDRVTDEQIAALRERVERYYEVIPIPDTGLGGGNVFAIHQDEVQRRAHGFHSFDRCDMLARQLLAALEAALAQQAQPEIPTRERIETIVLRWYEGNPEGAVDELCALLKLK